MCHCQHLNGSDPVAARVGIKTARVSWSTLCSAKEEIHELGIDPIASRNAPRTDSKRMERKPSRRDSSL